MSVIHEAIKRARESHRQKDASVPSKPPSPPVSVIVSKRSAGAWLWWLTLALFLLQAGLYFRERGLRQRTGGKLQSAFLQLNDERGKTLELLRQKASFEAQAAALRRERDEAITERDALSKAKQQVEFDNLEKEKAVSRMTKDAHELEMDKLRLESEVRSLKERASVSSEPLPSQK